MEEIENGATEFVRSDVCGNCGSEVDVWESEDGAYTVRLDRGSETEHEC